MTLLELIKLAEETKLTDEDIESLNIRINEFNSYKPKPLDMENPYTI